eukprot:c7742_g2_i3.p1 GENE.c7742_g2_i3~~c7742_g2_i3.p1  ORF type:complete len:1021 (+),score=256.35 c7742_g2_i3:429-3065(+)
MRKYQLEGLNWMITLHHNGINGILADEMGLGKTLQSISILGYLRSYAHINGPHLVICPKSTLGNWMKEFGRWAPDINVKRFHGGKDDRPLIKERDFKKGTFDVCVTTYEMAVAEKAFLGKFKWHYLIVDEAHRIKNENSVLSRVVRTFPSNSRLLITGTPLQNNLHELWAMLNFILPELFHSSEDFDDWFDTTKGNVERSVIERLHKLLKPFLLRRLKADVEKDLPPKKEIRLFVPMSELQRQTYKNILERNISALNDVGATRVQLLNLVMQLRKCCNHPYLFDGVEQPPFVTDERLVKASGKIMVLDRFLPMMKARGDRVLIFSQMTRLLDILEDYVMWKGYKYCRLDGSTSGEDRDRQMEQFNEENSDIFIFLLSTRAGGLGVNLYTANVVILYDSDWNPQADLQAMDRAHRIGQKREVTVYRFVCENTVEEAVVKKAQKKMMLDQMVIQQGKLLEKVQALGKEEMLSMVKKGAQDILLSTTGSGNEGVDLDKILASSVERTSREDAELVAQFGEGANRMNFTFDGSGMYEFEGTDYKESDRERRERLDVNYIALPKREHKKAQYNENAFFKGAAAAKANKPKAPKQPELFKFQFHHSARLDELRQKEADCFQKLVALHSKCESENSWDTYDTQKKEVEEEFGLTSEERTEMASLMEGGFSNWTKKDFNNFVRACEQYGRDDVGSISLHVEGKEPQEVQQYHEVFFARYREIDGWEKLIKGIEKNERAKQRVTEVKKLLDQKVRGVNSPEDCLKLPASVAQKRGFVEENDRFLLVQLHRLGYGDDQVYQAIQVEIRKSPRFRFDYFFKSRNVEDLKKRAETLVKTLEKEKTDSEKPERERKEKETKKKEVDPAKKRAHETAVPKSDETTLSKKRKK